MAGSEVAHCWPSPQPHSGQSPSGAGGQRPNKGFSSYSWCPCHCPHHPQSCPGRFWLQTPYLQLGMRLHPALVGGPE